MKQLCTLAALVGALGVGSLAFSQSSSSTNSDAKRVEELVQQLGSTKYLERERAQKDLEAIGNSALPALRKAAKEGDLEIGRRAAELVHRMEEKNTTENLLAPKKVHLKLNDIPVLDAVLELSKQSGYMLQVDGDRTVLNTRKVTLNTGETSFWEALDKLCAQAGLTEKIVNVATNPTYGNPSIKVKQLPPIQLKPLPAPAPGGLPNGQVIPQKAGALAAQAPAPPKEQPKAQAVQAQVQVQIQGNVVQAPGAVLPALVPINRPVPGNNRQIVLADGKPMEVPTCYSGAVRVRLLSPATVQMQKRAGESLLVFDISAEPRLQGFQVLGSPSIMRALDDQGQSLAMAMDVPQEINPNVQFQNRLIALPHNPQNQNRPVPVRLKLGEKPATTLKELTGDLTAQVQLPPEPLVVLDNVLKGQGQTAKGKNGGSITLQGIDKTANNEYRVQMTLENVQGQNNPFGMGGIQIIGNAQVQVQWGGIPSNLNGGLPELLDAQGKAYQITQIPTRSMQINNGSIRQNLTVVFRATNGQGEPTRLVLNGTRMTNINVPFTFKDVPLP